MYGKTTDRKPLVCKTNTHKALKKIGLQISVIKNY